MLTATRKQAVPGASGLAGDVVAGDTNVMVVVLCDVSIAIGICCDVTKVTRNSKGQVCITSKPHRVFCVRCCTVAGDS